MWPLLPNLHYLSCATGWGVTVTSLSYNEDATKRHSSCPPESSPLRHDILARTGKWLGCVIHWGGRSIGVHANMGRHIDPAQGQAPASALLPPPPRGLRHAVKGGALIEEHYNDVCHCPWFRSSGGQEGREWLCGQWSRRMSQRGGGGGGGGGGGVGLEEKRGLISTLNHSTLTVGKVGAGS